MNGKKIVILGGIGNGSVIASAIEDAFGKNSMEVKIWDNLMIGSRPDKRLKSIQFSVGWILQNLF